MIRLFHDMTIFYQHYLKNVFIVQDLDTYARL